MEVLTAKAVREITFEHLGDNSYEFQDVMEKIVDAAKTGNFKCIYDKELSYPTILKLRELGYDVNKIANEESFPYVETKICW